MEPFSLDAGAFCWINGEADDPEDLCLHGHAVARIAGETVEFDCAVSAAALYLLKSLTEDHLLGQGEQFFPCCGFFCIADEAGENVEIVGCDTGADGTVLHAGANVRLILPDGREQTLPRSAYREQVFRFADKVEAHYAALRAQGPAGRRVRPPGIPRILAGMAQAPRKMSGRQESAARGSNP